MQPKLHACEKRTHAQQAGPVMPSPPAAAPRHQSRLAQQQQKHQQQQQQQQQQRQEGQHPPPEKTLTVMSASVGRLMNSERTTSSASVFMKHSGRPLSAMGMWL